MSALRHPLRDRILLRIRRGDLGTVREIMIVGSVPRQTVNRWLREDGIDLERLRMRRVARMHEQEERYLAGLPAKRKPSKALLHWLAGRAKRRWDMRHEAQRESVPSSASGDIDL